MTADAAHIAPDDLEAVLWRLISGSDSQDGDAFLALLDETAEAFAGSSEPR